MITYPPFPQNGNIATELVQILIWIFEIPVIAMANGIIGISGNITNGLSSSAITIFSFPGQIFQQTVSAFKAYGVLAPIIASVIWGISIIILVFMVLKAVQIGGDELTNEE